MVQIDKIIDKIHKIHTSTNKINDNLKSLFLLYACLSRPETY